MEVINGVVAVIYRDSPAEERKYLLLKHKNNFWTFIGGKIDPTDSSIRDGLEREINEELELLPTDYDLTDTGIVNEFIYGEEKPDRAGKKGVTYYFTGILTTSKEINCKAEIVQLDWLNKEEILGHLEFDDIKRKFLEVVNTSSTQ
jgi:8-oxo-dGTP pyrophosphatase MutT (NUDIX family)